MKKMPTPNEIPNGGCLIEIIDATPDNLGRQRFTAFWCDNYLPPSGVRAQVFFAVVSERTDEWDAKKKPWAFWTA